MSEIIEVPAPRAASRDLTSFLIFHTSMFASVSPLPFDAILDKTVRSGIGSALRLLGSSLSPVLCAFSACQNNAVSQLSFATSLMQWLVKKKAMREMPNRHFSWLLPLRRSSFRWNFFGAGEILSF